MSPDDVLNAMESSTTGLSGEQVATRLARDGRNGLPTAAQRPAWRRLLGHFHDVLIYILIAAAALKAISNDWVDFTVIAVVIVTTAVIGFIQEGRAASALASLATMQSLDAQVLRDGDWQVIDAAELVCGDLVRVRSGDRVPADLRLVAASALQADEAALTGESVAAVKDLTVTRPDAALGDRCAMLFSGTFITAGNGVGVVVATGSDTEIGRISALVAEQDQLDTPLSRQLTQLGKQLSLLICVMALAMLIIGRTVHDFSRDDLISAAIGFAVAAVPEGLPALVTVTLALGVQQMARRRAITRKMSAVETLGSVTTICSDKTGTLTQNEMVARSVVTASATYAVEGSGYSPIGRVLTADDVNVDLAQHPSLAALLRTVAATSDARVEQTSEGWRVVGQPTEGALVVAATRAGIDASTMTRLSQVPFESSHKFSASLDEMSSADGGSRVVHVVGAPDRLLDRSSSMLTADGGSIALDRSHWEMRIDELSAQGLRVLAAAQRPATGMDEITLSDLTDGLTFLGLIGIVDPPRPEATAAITDAHTAGIRVKMITGDHKGTALAIAQELGIITAGETATALTGPEIEAMRQDELAEVVRAVDVYARTSPEHKLRIVRALQSHGEIVAMTGDGVNDAPSITRADVGVAMGIKGTEATKEAADIVLADDNFATIERAVEEGRRIYDNIRKSVAFLLPTNGAQALIILVAVVLGWALPLTPVQILWVNLATALTLSLALANEPAEPGIMQRPPRSPKEQVLSPQTMMLVLWTSVLIGVVTLWLFLIEREIGVDLAVAQTTAVTMLAFGQLAYLLNCRFLNSSSLTWRVLVGNKTVWIAIGALLALQCLFIYAPFMNLWFESAPIGLGEWSRILINTVIIFLVVELGKWLSRRIFTSKTRGPVTPDVR